MGRPGPNKEQERTDTTHWCQQIRTYSGLSDAKIEAALWPPAMHEALPDGRDFHRWRTGARAMDADALQSLVARARSCGLLPTASGLRVAAERRVSPSGKAKRVSEDRKAHDQSVRSLHRTRSAAAAALRAYEKELSRAQHVVAVDTSAGEEVHLAQILEMADAIDAHAFLDLSPWSRRS